MCEKRQIDIFEVKTLDKISVKYLLAAANSIQFRCAHAVELDRLAETKAAPALIEHQVGAFRGFSAASGPCWRMSKLTARKVE